MAFTVTTESINKGERTTTTRFIIHDAELAVKEYDDEPAYRPALEVTTSHNKDRKMLTTMISRVMLNGRIIRAKIELRSDDSFPEGVNPYVGVRIARYSSKALEERHTLIMDNLADYKDALIEWASRATM